MSEVSAFIAEEMQHYETIRKSAELRWLKDGRGNAKLQIGAIVVEGKEAGSTRWFDVPIADEE